MAISQSEAILMYFVISGFVIWFLILVLNSLLPSINHKKSMCITPPLTMEQFINEIKTNECVNPHWDNIGDYSNYEWTYYKLGDLGKVYGHQWRNQNGVDQVKEVLDGLKSNPYSRYHIIDGWNKADFKDMALPPCHLLYQFIVRPIQSHDRTNLAWDMGLKKAYGDVKPKLDTDWNTWFDEQGVPKFYLDLNMYQRSCDTMLGVPFNIASLSLLLMLFAKASNMEVGISTWIGGDTHLYVNHIELAKEQISRVPYDLPQLLIKKELKLLVN